MPTFPIVSLLDSLTRATENPLSNGGKWGILKVGAALDGRIESESWRSASSFATGEDAAYWTVKEFSSGAICVELHKSTIGFERIFTLYTCIANPTSATELNGYALSAANTSESTHEFTFSIEKITKNVRSLLSETKKVVLKEGDRIGLYASSGIVSVWHKEGAGSWTQVAEVSDATYRKGFVAFGAKGNEGFIRNAEAGSGLDRVLSATQGQAPSRSTTPGRVMTVAQAQVYLPNCTAIPSLSAVDNFARANENPLTDGGKWGLLFGMLNKGQLLEESYVSLNTFAEGEDGAFKAIEEIRYPAISSTLKAGELGVGRTMTLYSCMSSNPSIEITGYAIVLTGLEGGKTSMAIQRVVKGVRTPIAEGLITLAVGDSFMLTVVSGALTAWHKVGAGSWEKVAQGADATFKTGFIAIGVKGNITHMGGVSAGAGTEVANPVSLIAGKGKSQTFSTTQTQAVSVPIKQLAHTLTPSVTQVPRFAHSLGRLLSVAQPQVPVASKLIRRLFAPTQATIASLAEAKAKGAMLTTTQPQSAAQNKCPARTLEAPQTQAPTIARTPVARLTTVAATQAASLARALARTLPTPQATVATVASIFGRRLAVAAGQALALSRAPGRGLSATQPQSAGISGAMAHGSVLATTQPQSVVEQHGPTRTCSVTQTQLAQRSAAVSRMLVNAQAQSPRVGAGATRALSATQPQVAMIGTGHEKTQTFGVLQAQSAATRLALARTISITQPIAASCGRSPRRAISTTQPQVAGRVAVPWRQLVTVQPQTPTVTGPVAHQTFYVSLSCAQGQALTLRHMLLRYLSTAVPSTPSLARSPSITLHASSSLAVGIGRSETRTLPCEASQVVAVGAARAYHRQLLASQPTMTQLERSPSRRLGLATGQTVTLVGSVTYGALLPPAILVASTGSSMVGSTITPVASIESGTQSTGSSSGVGSPRIIKSTVEEVQL